MDINNLTGGGGGSSWALQGPTRQLASYSIKRQHEEQLLKEAASLVPDSQEMVKSMMAHKVPYADMAPREQEFYSIMNDYLTEYQKSPFNAFSEPMKRKVKSMQRMVHDPMLKQLEEDYSSAQKEIDKVNRDQNLGTLVNFKNGMMPIIRLKKDQAGNVVGRYDMEVHMDDYNPETDVALDINQDWEYLTKHQGIGKRGKKFSIELTSPSELNRKILSFFSGTGADQTQQFSENVAGLREKFNSNQIASMKKALTQGAGMTQSDWDTMYALYQSKNRGQKLSKQDADKWVMEYIDDIAKGKTSDLESASGKSGAGGAGENLKDAQQADDFSLAINGRTSPFTGTQTLLDEKNNSSILNVYHGGILNGYWENSTREIKDDNDNKIPAKTLADNRYFQTAQKALVRNQLTGAYEEIPYINELGGAAVGSAKSPVGAVTMITDPQGNPVDPKLQEKLFAHNFKRDGVPGEFREYVEKIGVDDKGQEMWDLRRRPFIVAHYNVIDRSNMNEGNQAVSRFSEDMSRMGYTSRDMDSQEEEEYKMHNKAGFSTGFAFYNNDQTYTVPLFIPVPSLEVGRKAAGKEVLLPQQAATVGTMSQQGPSSQGFIYQTPEVRKRMNDSYNSQNSLNALD